MNSSGGLLHLISNRDLGKLGIDDGLDGHLAAAEEQAHVADETGVIISTIHNKYNKNRLKIYNYTQVIYVGGAGRA